MKKDHRSSALSSLPRWAAILMLHAWATANAAPQGGLVSSGNAQITQGAATTIVTQGSANAVIQWSSFNVGALESVQFIQPSTRSVVVNQVTGTAASSILGRMSANGQVFLVNPNGIVFGSGATVLVGGLVASALSGAAAPSSNGSYQFAGSGEVLNLGHISTPRGGFVVLMGSKVSNAGSIFTPMGTTALAAAGATDLQLDSSGFVNLALLRGHADTLAQNTGLIQADGGRVQLTTLGMGPGSQSAVNNTGVIRAQTVENHQGTILLLGDMDTGTLTLSGKLDASAPAGGHGGHIETSAAHVQVTNTAQVTTAAPLGKSGTWLIDPTDFTIARDGDMTAEELSRNLDSTSVTIASTNGSVERKGGGDVTVNEPINWNAATTLTLNAVRDVSLNATITTAQGSLVLIAGQNVNVNAKEAINITEGTVTFHAGINSTTPGSLIFSDKEPQVLVSGGRSSATIYTPLWSTEVAKDHSANFKLSDGVALTQSVSFIGLTGFAGAVGATGDPGPQGSVGLAGAAGRQGDPGIQGIAGIQGMTGRQGDPGVQGPVGSRGVNGANGTDGAAGVNGAPGSNGMTGAAGSNGADGAAGAAGAMGPAGSVGATGDRGAEGSAGLAGANGRPGDPGIQGIQGIQGPVGASGQNGAVGPAGAAGAAGANGANGAAGRNGLNGAAGLNGADGAVGATGPSGAAGTNGLNASQEQLRVGPLPLASSDQILQKSPGAQTTTSAAGTVPSPIQIQPETSEETAAQLAAPDPADGAEPVIQPKAKPIIRKR